MSTWDGFSRSWLHFPEGGPSPPSCPPVPPGHSGRWVDRNKGLRYSRTYSNILHCRSNLSRRCIPGSSPTRECASNGNKNPKSSSACASVI